MGGLDLARFHVQERRRATETGDNVELAPVPRSEVEDRLFGVQELGPLFGQEGGELADERSRLGSQAQGFALDAPPYLLMRR